MYGFRRGAAFFLETYGRFIPSFADGAYRCPSPLLKPYDLNLYPLESRAHVRVACPPPPSQLYALPSPPQNPFSAASSSSGPNPPTCFALFRTTRMPTSCPPPGAWPGRRRADLPASPSYKVPRGPLSLCCVHPVWSLSALALFDSRTCSSFFSPLGLLLDPPAPFLLSAVLTGVASRLRPTSAINREPLGLSDEREATAKLSKSIHDEPYHMTLSPGQARERGGGGVSRPAVPVRFLSFPPLPSPAEQDDMTRRLSMRAWIGPRQPLNAAIKASPIGARIMLSEGLYTETLVIDKVGFPPPLGLSSLRRRERDPASVFLILRPIRSDTNSR